MIIGAVGWDILVDVWSDNLMDSFSMGWCWLQ